MTPRYGDLIPLPGTGYLGGGRRLAGSGQELVPVEGGVEEDDNSLQQGRGGAAGFRVLFKAVVQAVLLFGSDTWVVTPCMVKVLGGLQVQVEQRLKVRIPRRKTDGKWVYTLATMAR